MFKMPTKEYREKGYVFKKIGSPIGSLTLIASDEGLRGLLFENTTGLSLETLGKFREDKGHKILRTAEIQLSEYFKGTRRRFDIALVYPGTPFQRRVWELLLDIPYGETVSYGEIASRIGDSRKARPVGGAVGTNPIGIMIPCHRVIGKNGALTGFGGGLEVKSFLLNLERGHRTGI